jgi:hypothetical protein
VFDQVRDDGIVLDHKYAHDPGRFDAARGVVVLLVSAIQGTHGPHAASMM